MDPETPRSYTLLDGATATGLFSRGMPAEGCQEEWILRNPLPFQSLQRAYREAGSRILTAPTFSANRCGLARFGRENEVHELNLRLTALTREVAGQDLLVAGNLSPTGLSLGPAGSVSFDELVDIYVEQANALNEAGTDLFLVETMLSVTEARAALLACRRYGKPVLLSAGLNSRGELFSGATPLAALLTLQGLGLGAFGFNCAPPACVAAALREIMPFASLPLLAEPSAGEPDKEGRYPLSPAQWGKEMEEVLAAGASFVGGCCGTGPEHIGLLRGFTGGVPAAPRPSREELPDLFLTNTSEVFRLDNDRLEFTAPIRCSTDMAEELLAAEEESADVLYIEVETPDDALAFSQNEHLAHLPVCFHSDSEEALERALFLYNGRCMVDIRSAIGSESTEALARRYGAAPY